MNLGHHVSEPNTAAPPAPARVKKPAFKRQRRSPEWGMSLALALAVAAGFAAVGPLFTNSGWWLGAVSVATVVLVSIAAARALLPWPAFAPLVGVVVLLLLSTALFASEQALLGVIPTRESLQAFAEITRQAFADVAGSRVPMPPEGAITFVLTAGAGLVAIVVDLCAIAWRRPALIGIPFAALVALPGIFRVGTEQWLFVALVAAAYLFVLYLGSGEARPAGAVAVGAGGIVLAVLLPFVLPSVSASERPPSLGGTSVDANTVIDLSKNLHLPTPIDVLTYQSLTDEPEYLRLGTISDLADDSWALDAPDTIDGSTLADFSAPRGLGDRVQSVPRTTSIQTTALSGNRLPAPYAPESVEGTEEGQWKWDQNDLTISTTTASSANQSYVVESTLALPTEEQLRAAGPVDPQGFGRYLGLPNGLPATVKDRALAVTADAATAFDRAEALQSYFTGGAFAYSESAPVEQGFDGASGDVIARFLDVKRGYCVHFSSAMTVMARSLGIPARIAVGFTAGTHIDIGGDQEPYYQVTSQNLHAWPELYFEGVGWVRFEPTPGRGEVPDYSNLPIPTPSDTDNPEPTTTFTFVAPSPEPSDTSTFSAPSDGPRFQPEVVLPRIVLSLLSIGFVVIMLLPLLPAARRLIRRLRRYARVRSSGDPQAAWQELSDTATDAALAVSALTPTELAELLRPLLSDHEALERLLAAIETDAYSRGAGTAALADLRAVQRDLSASLTVRERIVAAFNPQSMRQAPLQQSTQSTDVL
jgi:transglutaminase-like putative cysteine protease